MSKPDFTGTWAFNPGKSRLQIRAPDETLFVIDHREPDLHISRTHQVAETRDSFSLDLTTDGREVSIERADLRLRARAYWEGDTLVFDSRLTRAGEEATNVVRYTLSADGQRFLAEERFRSPSSSYDNTWALDRVGGGGTTAPSMPVLDTGRLALRRLSLDDAEFILRLLNEPSFLRFIGDKGVRTLADARRYISTGPTASYERFGFGLLLVELKEGREPIGICGLLKRDWLDHADLGFAFLPRFWSRGYAFESASAVLDHTRRTFGLKRILAITAPDNAASVGLLRKLGFRPERTARPSQTEPEVEVFASDV
jgi:RimJ/RimL family protein N-acetyltransferase